jgi:large subunit ribosomal protein L4
MLKIIEYKLPKEIFGQEINLKLLAQANFVFSSRAHIGLRNTKTRSEVNRTTKKVYKQKGTGGARHGSRRANVFVGGGIIFGPRAEKRVLTLSKGLKQAARISAFSAKAKDKEISVVSGVSKIAKTKEVAEFLKKLTAKRFTVLLSDKSGVANKFLRNLSNVRAVGYKDANALDILNGGQILIDEEVFEKKETKVAKKEVVSAKAGKTAKAGKKETK